MVWGTMIIVGQADTELAEIALESNDPSLYLPDFVARALWEAVGCDLDLLEQHICDLGTDRKKSDTGPNTQRPLEFDRCSEFDMTYRSCTVGSELGGDWDLDDLMDAVLDQNIDPEEPQQPQELSAGEDTPMGLMPPPSLRDQQKYNATAEQDKQASNDEPV